jgi:hypothetical protein
MCGASVRDPWQPEEGASTTLLVTAAPHFSSKLPSWTPYRGFLASGFPVICGAFPVATMLVSSCEYGCEDGNEHGGEDGNEAGVPDSRPHCPRPRRAFARALRRAFAAQGSPSRKCARRICRTRSRCRPCRTAISSSVNPSTARNRAGSTPVRRETPSRLSRSSPRRSCRTRPSSGAELTGER